MSHMMKKAIGRRCDEKGCPLTGRLQESGLIVCPECGSELVDVLIPDRRMQAVLVAALVLVGATGGFVAYGYIARAMSPLELVRLLRGQIEISQAVQAPGSEEWVNATIRLYDASGPIPGEAPKFGHEVRDGRRTATLRERLAHDTTIAFDVTPGRKDVSAVYFLHADGEHTRLLFAADPSSGPLPASLSIPGTNGSGIRQGIKLTGAGDEHFVLVAATKAIPALGPDRKDVDVGAELASAERNADIYVLHVIIPHS